MIINNESITGHSIPCIVRFTDGRTERRRFVNVPERGYFGLYGKRRRARYTPASSLEGYVAEVTLLAPKENSVVDNIRRNGNRFLKERDPRLWNDLAAKVRGILDNLDADVAQAKEDGKGFRDWHWEKYHEEWMRYKPSRTFVTVNTAFGKHRGPEVTEGIRKALDDGTEYTARGYVGYDNSIQVQAKEDGKDRKAWLSREYRDCGNGHYYLLLSPTHAVYIEKD